MDMPTPCECCDNIEDFNDMIQCEICERWACRFCRCYSGELVCKDCEKERHKE